MKLATYKDGSRDGQLIVVSRDLSQAHYASGIASRMQQVLDDWNYLSPQLQDLYDVLNAGKARHAFAFDPRQCMAPLPRAYQWVSSYAFANHRELLAKAGSLDTSGNPSNEPLMRQLGGDNLLGATDPFVCASEAVGIDFGAGVVVITGDLPMGCASDRALEGIRLLALTNEVSLRTLHTVVEAEVCTLVQSQPASAFSPVAVTPDELGEGWSRGRLQLPLQVSWNGRKVGLCDAGQDMRFHFGKLLAFLCTTRQVRAGCIVGSGPVSNKGAERKSGIDWPNGYSTIIEKRAMETLQDGQASTEYMRFGDTVRIEMKSRDGVSIFGAIEQSVIVVSGNS
jgi:fumarylacetoacetate (FAA) hydrolase